MSKVSLKLQNILTSCPQKSLKRPLRVFTKFAIGLGRGVEYGAQDAVDRLHKITGAVLVWLTLFVFVQYYFDTLIACYIPMAPSGQQFSELSTKYCWMHGTIPLSRNERVPQTDKLWAEYDKHRRITYYQWVPLILILQSFMCYIPYCTWLWLTRRRVCDLNRLVKRVQQADLEMEERTVENVVDFVQTMYTVEANKKRLREGAEQNFAAKCKKFTSSLLFSHLAVKVLAIFQCLMQLVLMYYYLGLASAGDTSLALEIPGTPTEEKGLAYTHRFTFGLTVLADLFAGRTWQDTLMFPRVAYCRIPAVRLVGVQNCHIARCALPLNMVNEKLFVLLWWWMALLVLLGSVNLAGWIYTTVRGDRQQEKFALMLEARKTIDSGDGLAFVRRYVLGDVLWLLHILLAVQGELFVSKVLKSLYTKLHSHSGHSDRDDDKRG